MTCTLVNATPKKAGKRTYPDLVGLRDTLCDTHNQANLVLNSLDDSVGGGGWGNVEDGGVRLGLSDRLYMPKSSDLATSERRRDVPPSRCQRQASQDGSVQPSLGTHLPPSWCRTPTLPLRGKYPVSRWLSVTMKNHRRKGTDGLSGETLAQNLGVLVDEEVLRGVLVTSTSRRLGERPASIWQRQ